MIIKFVQIKSMTIKEKDTIIMSSHFIMLIGKLPPLSMISGSSRSFEDNKHPHPSHVADAVLTFNSCLSLKVQFPFWRLDIYP